MTRDPTLSDAAERMERTFLKNGGNGPHTMLYSRLTDSVKAFLKEKTGFNEDDEIPVIGSHEDHGNWLLLTTLRVFCCDKHNFMEIRNDDISHADLDTAGLLARRETPASNKYLDIYTLDGKLLKIVCDPGEPFMGLWNVFRDIAFNAKKVGAKRR